MNTQTIHFSECILCGGSSLPEFTIAAKTHNVRHRGSFRRLCTACLLKTHPGFFCPICFSVYSSPLPASLSRLCSSCAAIAHSHCAKTPNFKCLSCANPTTFSFFKISDCERIATTQENGVLSKRVVFTEDLARQLLCAAEIAELSMGKAVESAFGDVEKKGREAAFARKRAKEAVDKFFDLVERNAKVGGGEFLGGNLFRD